MKLSSVGKIAVLLLGLCGIAAAQPAGQPASQAAPPEALASATAAVAALGKQVEIGRYEYAIQKMYPTWKERMAGRLGGEAELEKQLAAVSRQMVSAGVTITSFTPQGRPSSYEVGIGKKVENVGGQHVESMTYTKWLVLVPTLTKFTVINKENGQTMKVDSTGFQAAISDKGKNDWTFIDGSSLNANELRKLFVNLPQDIELPPVGKKEAH